MASAPAIPPCPGPSGRSRRPNQVASTRARPLNRCRLPVPVGIASSLRVTGVEITYFSDAQLPRSIIRQRSLQKGINGSSSCDFFFADRTLHSA